MTEVLLVPDVERDYVVLDVLTEDNVDQAVVEYVGEVVMTGCIIYPDCPTPNSCSKGCKYLGLSSTAKEILVDLPVY